MIDFLESLNNSIAIYPRNNWGLIEVTGGDRQSFLHNQTTNNFQKLKIGEGCQTVFVTSTARTIDLVTAYLQEDRILLLVSPHKKEQLLAWMDKFLFPSDKVKLADISDKYRVYSLLGQNSQNFLEPWVNEAILKEKEHNNYEVLINDFKLTLAIGNGLALSGYNLIIPLENVAKIEELLREKEAITVTEEMYETIRIIQGIPKPDAELTEDYNPLEVGLWQTISFEKGCYIGQETIARLNTYKGIKQRLWGIKVDFPVLPSTIITVAGEKVGIITSYTDTKTGGFALGYIRTKAGGIGLKVQIGEVMGEVVTLPFVSHPLNY